MYLSRKCEIRSYEEENYLLIEQDLRLYDISLDGPTAEVLEIHFPSIAGSVGERRKFLART